MKTTKQILSAILACSLIAGMSVTSFAAINPPTAVSATVETTDPVEGGTVESTGTTTAPVFKAMLPSSAPFILNPYKMDDEGQILATEMTIENRTPATVNLYAKSVVGTPNDPATIKLSTAVPAATVKDKQIFMFLRAGETLAVFDPADAKINPFKAATATAAGDVAVVAKASTTPVLLATLGAGTAGAAGAGGSVKATFYGAMTPNPDAPWTADDTLDVSTVFSFKVIPTPTT